MTDANKESPFCERELAFFGAVTASISHELNNAIAIIERDNQGGTDGRIKLITEIDVDEVAFSDDPVNALPVLTKTVVRDLFAEGDLTRTNGLVPEKIEGLAVTPDGTAWVVNDNDGVDDNSGETRLVTVGPIN